MILPRKFLRMCRRDWRRAKLADSTKAELTGGQLLTRTLILRRVLRREVLADDERLVGLLLPPTVAGAVANAAVSLDGRVAVNLNYTASSEVVNHCIRQAGIRHVLTSRRLMERVDLKLDAELVYLEDLREKVTTADKLLGAAAARFEPLGMLERRLGLLEIPPDDLLTIVFTSGSTGMPKGVMLSHRNVGSNIDAFASVIHLGREDVLVGILPLFHSFGYTATLWTALTLEPKTVYHHNPLEARPVGQLCQRHGATILIATPTFLRTYIRRCTPEQFSTVQLVLTGAEKLSGELANQFEQKLGIRPVEGYGTTELSPVVSVNVPRDRAPHAERNMNKEGTVGLPLPGVRAKVVDLDTGEDLGPNKSGMLRIAGPNVMQGYLDLPDKTAEVLHDGWYTTGDVAVIDDEGFIRITGRISRFSKIGGEMVPHIRIEEAISQTLGLDEDDQRIVVTGVPDERKGERIVVLHTGLEVPPEDIRRRLGEAGLPPLWIPSADSFRRVDEIPVLGTGKLDLKRVKEKAQAEFAAAK